MYLYSARDTQKCPGFLFPSKSLFIHPYAATVSRKALNTRYRVHLYTSSTRVPNGPFVLSMMARSSDKSNHREKFSTISGWVNVVLSSSRLAAAFVGGALVAYSLAAIFLAQTLSGNGRNLVSLVGMNLRTGSGSLMLAPHHRITLMALAILLPDFRHVLGAYADAVRALRVYRSPMSRFPFTLPTRSSTAKRDRAPVRREVYSRLASESVAASRSQSRPQPQSSQDDQHPIGFENARSPKKAKQNRIPFTDLRSQMPPWLATRVTVAQREMRRWQEQGESWLQQVFAPARESAVQLQHLALRTEITLRKDVGIAAGSIILSLFGYTVALTADVTLAALIIVMANLAPSILLSRSAAPRHELLALVRDVRISAAIAGALTSALSVFRPLIASYIFLLCCLLLVITRDPVAWMRNLWNWR